MAAQLSYDAARFTGIESAQFEATMPLRKASPAPRRAPRSSSLEPARLQKPQPSPQQHVRAASGPYAPTNTQNDIYPPRQYGARSHLDVPGPAVPPLVMGAAYSRNAPPEQAQTPLSGTSSRPVTPIYTIASSYPTTPSSATTQSSASEEKQKHGWFGKKKDKHEQHEPLAWIAGHRSKPAYDIDSLLQGRPVGDLWDNAYGNCCVHLFPPHFNKGSSFRLNTIVLQSSPILARMAEGRPGDDGHLHLQLKLSNALMSNPARTSTSDPSVDDLQTLVDFRNLFAFLCGGSLVATEKRSSFFGIFIAIASLLRAYEFSNADGSTFGEVADISFDRYAEELGIADVSVGREKIVEGLVLGERMRSVKLYSEAFTHAVGRLDDIVSLNMPKFEMISPATKMRLNRASLDLSKRESAVQLILKDFEFPSIFSGIMNSKTAEERKEGVRFDAWKEAFLNTRKWMLATLKHQYGDWPPKAKSKKNDLEISGLQRQVLRHLYIDLCSMYDLIADRNELTTRTVDGIDRAGPVEAPWVRALRSILSEYDRSSPPVKPPVPFDLPRLPAMPNTRRDVGNKLNPEQRGSTRKLKDDELFQVLRGSWNEDAVVTPFVNNFRDMERRAASGCTLQELVDLRIGQWIFMYAVMQALPLLAMDAPGIKYKKGVEYFLCAAPRDGMPWIDPQRASFRKTWYAVGDAGHLVNMPSNVLENSTEGIYRRSHCWQKAEQWTRENPILHAALQEQSAAAAQSSLPPPEIRQRSRSSSPRNWRNSSLNPGMEPLSVPPSLKSVSSQQTLDAQPHKVDSNKTFDAIIAAMDDGKSKKKKNSGPAHLQRK